MRYILISLFFIVSNLAYSNYWEKKGSDIIPVSTNEISSISLNATGDIIAVSSYANWVDGTPENPYVAVYEFSVENNEWVQLGGNIQTFVNWGSFELNDTGNILATIRPSTYAGVQGALIVYEYSQENNSWIQKGDIPEIDYFFSDMPSPKISISGDGYVIAASNHNYNTYEGIVRIYNFNESQNIWEKNYEVMGPDKSSSYPVSYFGQSLSLNQAGDILAIGAPYEGDGSDGKVEIYHLNLGSWSLRDTIPGWVNADRKFGQDVSLNSSGDKLLISMGYKGGSFLAGPLLYNYNSSTQSWQSAWSYNLYNVFMPSAKLSGDGKRFTYSSHHTQNGFFRLYEENTDGDPLYSETFSHFETSNYSDISRNGKVWAFVENQKVKVYTEPPHTGISNINSFYELPSDSSLIIDATPIEGYPNVFTYQWYLNGLAIPSLYGGSDATFTIAPLEANNGDWRVDVTNTAGTTSNEFNIRIVYDSDNDNIYDYRETNTGTYVSSTDTGTDPNNPDSDGDGLNDGIEILTHNTDPNNPDSDGDGLSDKVEVDDLSSNPNSIDSDSDGFPDNVEYYLSGFDINSDSSSLSYSGAGLIEQSAYDAVVAERDAALAAQANAETSRDTALAEKASAEAERDSRPTQASYDTVVAERDARPTQAAYDALVVERDAKLTLDEVKDLRAGSTMIEVHNGQATLTMEVEESDNLGIWTNGGASTLQIPIDAESGKKFFRFKMAE